MVICSKRALHGYKVRASKVFPKEYVELMFGTLDGDKVSIEKIVPIRQYGTKMCVWFDEDEGEDIIAATDSASGLEFVGTIHTHTFTHKEVGKPEHLACQAPSHADNDGAEYWEEQVFAIDVLTKGKSGKFSHAVFFYRPQVPLQEVAYF